MLAAIFASYFFAQFAVCIRRPGYDFLFENCVVTVFYRCQIGWYIPCSIQPVYANYIRVW